MSSDFYINSIRPYAGIILKICRVYGNSREDIEDLYQEVCLQIWRTKENFKGNSEWSTWIYRISLNVCMTFYKKEQKRKLQTPTLELSDNQNEDKDLVTFQNESFQQLHKAIKQLSEIDRAVILLYLEEKSYKEIAEIIGTNTNNIGVRIKRIKNRLKKIIKHYG